jgi:hypothetical protein
VDETVLRHDGGLVYVDFDYGQCLRTSIHLHLLLSIVLRRSSLVVGVLPKLCFDRRIRGFVQPLVFDESSATGWRLVNSDLPDLHELGVYLHWACLWIHRVSSQFMVYQDNVLGVANRPKFGGCRV